MYFKGMSATIIIAIVLTWCGVCFADSSSYNSSLELSIKEYFINYHEDLNDGETGWVTGWRAAFKCQNLTDNTYWRILYENTNANDHYNGSLQNGYPYQTTTNNSITTKEIIFANPMQGSSHTYAYIGYGTYNWNRNVNGGVDGIYQVPSSLEKYSWDYIPVGYRNEYKISNTWDGAVDMAVRFQLHSQMTAYSPPLDPFTVTLGNLPGFKLELPFACKMTSQWSFLVTPWLEYWGIRQSNWVPETVNGVPVIDPKTKQPLGAYEPNSHTDHYGVDLGIVAKF